MLNLLTNNVYGGCRPARCLASVPLYHRYRRSRKNQYALRSHASNSNYLLIMLLTNESEEARVPADQAWISTTVGPWEGRKKYEKLLHLWFLARIYFLDMVTWTLCCFRGKIHVRNIYNTLKKLHFFAKIVLYIFRLGPLHNVAIEKLFNWWKSLDTSEIHLQLSKMHNKSYQRKRHVTKLIYFFHMPPISPLPPSSCHQLPPWLFFLSASVSNILLSTVIRMEAAPTPSCVSLSPSPL